MQAVTLPIALTILALLAAVFFLTRFLIYLFGYALLKFLSVCFPGICPQCDGYGLNPNMTTCERCKGRGTL